MVGGSNCEASSIEVDSESLRTIIGVDAENLDKFWKNAEDLGIKVEYPEKVSGGDTAVLDGKSYRKAGNEIQLKVTMPNGYKDLTQLYSAMGWE